MGLDMSLFRAHNVAGLTSEQYTAIDQYVHQMLNDSRMLADGTTTTGPSSLDLESGTGIVGANALRDSIHVNGDPQSFTWFSIFEEIAYWRKANAVHAWFVNTVQDGVDGCQLSPPILSEHLTELRDRALLVLASRPEISRRPPKRVRRNSELTINTLKALVQDPRSPFGERQAAAIALAKNTFPFPVVAELLLPPQGGFFFGSTDIDSYYYEDLQDTVQQINQVLESTDFTTQVVFYHASW